MNLARRSKRTVIGESLEGVLGIHRCVALFKAYLFPVEVCMSRFICFPFWSLSTRLVRAGHLLAVSGLIGLLCGGAIGGPEVHRVHGGIGGRGLNQQLTEPNLGRVVEDQAGVHRVMLENRLELVVVSTSEYEPTDTQVWLIMRAGSVYENDQERGAGLLIEQIIRSGIAGFSSAEIDELLGVVPVDESKERSSGQPTRPSVGSFVGFDHAAFMGVVGNEQDDRFGRLLELYSQVLRLGDGGVSGDQIKHAKSAVIDKIAGMTSAEYQSRQEWLPVLMSGTRFGERFSGPSARQVDGLRVDDVLRFVGRMFQPGQAMVLVVGDVEHARVIDGVQGTLGGIRAGERVGMADGRLGIDVAGRGVLSRGYAFDGDQAAMIFFDDRGDHSVDDWSQRAGGYTYADLRRQVIDRVAGEIIRHRMDRLSTGELGGNMGIGLDQIDLWGQVDLVQIGIEHEQGSAKGWADSMRFLVRESDRLGRQGAVGDEIQRARRAVLSRWHRDADEWVSLENRSRAGYVHWLVATGRPILDVVRWDQVSTELMSTILDQEINDAVMRMVDPSRACFVALDSSLDAMDDQSGSGLDGVEVLAVVDEAMGSPMGPIDSRWMEKLAGPLMDFDSCDGQIREISQHSASGVWSASLVNGVRVWARSMRGVRGEHDEHDEHDENETVYVHATVWGDVLDSNVVYEDEVLAALTAWSSPGTETRGYRAILAYMAEHGLEVQAKREAGYVQLVVGSRRDSVDQALELAYVLLDRPVIDESVFEEHMKQARSGEAPIDRGIRMLYGRDPSRRVSQPRVTLDGAQRVLTQIVRHGQIDIGIAGDIDVETVIDRASVLFGTLADREKVVPGLTDITNDRKRGLKSRRSTRVRGELAEQEGLIVGYVGGGRDDLQAQRSLVMTSNMLSAAINERASKAGFEGKIRAHIGYSDMLPDDVLLIVRAHCKQEMIEQAEGVIEDSISALARDGIGNDELEVMKGKIVQSISGYFDWPSYWSERMSTMRVYDRRVDDLWKIRQGYAGVDAAYASRVFAEMVDSRDRFRIEVVVD